MIHMFAPDSSDNMHHFPIGSVTDAASPRLNGHATCQFLAAMRSQWLQSSLYRHPGYRVRCDRHNQLQLWELPVALRPDVRIGLGQGTSSHFVPWFRRKTEGGRMIYIPPVELRNTSYIQFVLTSGIFHLTLHQGEPVSQIAFRAAFKLDFSRGLLTWASRCTTPRPCMSQGANSRLVTTESS
jgi:hypothetical protein